jgi:hypothetical protein
MSLFKSLFGSSPKRIIPGILFAVSTDSLNRKDLQSIRKVLDTVFSLTAKKGSAHFIEMTFDGLQNDQRPIDQIPEVIAWSQFAQYACPELLHALTPGAIGRHLMCVIPDLAERLPGGKVALNLSSPVLRELTPQSGQAWANRLRSLGMSDPDIISMFETVVAQNLHAALLGRNQFGKDYGVAIE